jgi:hypothetical protein
MPFVMFDLSLVKQIRFTERKNFKIRAEFLNAFNFVNFNLGTCSGSSQNICQVTGSNAAPRKVQIALRLNF